MNAIFTNSQALFKKIFWAISVILIVAMPIISKDFGQSGDEDVEITYGQDIYNYFFNGDKTALYYPEDVRSPLQHLYGGMFNLIAEIIHQANPSWHIVDVRHVLGAFCGALLMIFTGLLCYQFTQKKWHWALLGLLFITFSPRIFGESMFNGKDIPYAMCFAITIYYLLKLIEQINTNHKIIKPIIGITIGIAIAIGVRTAGAVIVLGYIGVYCFLYYLINSNDRKLLLENNGKNIKKLIGGLLVATIVGYGIALFTWPFGLQAPLSNLLKSFEEMSNRQVDIRVLYDGRYIGSRFLPWQYEFNWIMITNPIIVLISALAMIPLFFLIKKRFGAFIPIILLFSILFPILYMIYKDSTLYDSWRHVFFVYPFIVVAAIICLDSITSVLKNKMQYIPYIVAIIGLLPTMAWTIKEHPNQYTYFNSLVGGPEGAEGKYDLDYYLTSGKSSARWILKNVPKPPNGQKIKVYTNMEGLEYYFHNDTNWIEYKYKRYYERNDADWDYYITYHRFVSEWTLQNKKWPPSNAVYIERVEGVPIGAVLKQVSKDAFLGNEALKKNDFQTAVIHFQKYISFDASDETTLMNYAVASASIGQMDQAIKSLNQAIAINGVQSNFHQLLAQIYQSMGDSNNANKSMRKAQKINMEQKKNYQGEKPF